MGVMGGEFQNWVGTSYLTEIDARQKDLQLSETENHPKLRSHFRVSIRYSPLFVRVLLNMREMWVSFIYPEKTVNFYEVKSGEPSYTLKIAKSTQNWHVCAHTHLCIRKYVTVGGKFDPPLRRIGLKKYLTM